MKVDGEYPKSLESIRGGLPPSRVPSWTLLVQEKLSFPPTPAQARFCPQHLSFALWLGNGGLEGIQGVETSPCQTSPPPLRCEFLEPGRVTTLS